LACSSDGVTGDVQEDVVLQDLNAIQLRRVLLADVRQSVVVEAVVIHILTAN
jgi:hypothetical protein